MKKIIIAIAICSFGALYGCTEEKQNPETVVSDTISLSSEIASVDNEGGSVEVVVTSSGDWRMTGNSDWAHPSAVEGSDGDKVTFAVDANATDSDREARYKFFTGSAVAELVIRNVAGYVMSLVSQYENGVPVDGGTVYVKLDTNIPSAEMELSFTEDGGSWIKCDSRTDVFGTAVLKLSISPNTLYTARTSELTVSAHSLSATVSVGQDQLDYLYAEETPVSFKEDGGQFTLDILHNVEYKVTCPEWITYGEPQVSEDSEKPGVTVDRYEFTVAELQMPVRSGAVTVSDLSGETTFTVNVSQLNENASTGRIPDKNLRSALANKGWITLVDPSNESEEVVIKTLEEIKAFDYYYDIFNISGAGCTSLEGIEYFPWVSNLNLADNTGLKTVDISVLEKVIVLQLNRCSGIETVNCGGNKCSINLEGNYSAKQITVSGATKSISGAGYSWSSYSGPEILDVTGCTALSSINVSYRNIATIYVTAEQKDAIDAGSLSVSKNEDTTITVK